MNLLFKLLLIVIASVGATGYHARAPLGETNSRPQAWVPRLAQAPVLMPVALSAPASHASVYVASVPAAAENGLVTSPAPNLLLGGDAVPEVADAGTVGTAAPSAERRVVSIPSSDGRVRAAAPVAIPAAYSVRVPATAGGAPSVLQDPPPSEPSGWSLLLSFFVIVGFIARRRSRLVAG